MDLGEQVTMIEPDDATALQEAFDRVVDKYDLFRPQDYSDGYAGRLANLLERLEHHRTRIEAALAYAHFDHTYDHVVAKAVAGHFTFWDCGGSCLFSEIIAYPNAVAFHVFLAGGDLDALLSCYDDMVVFAKRSGCDRVSVAGRPGWARVFSRLHGWSPASMHVMKRI